jgi:hypothetical protein
MLAMLLGPAAASAAPDVVIGIEQNGGIFEPDRRTEILDAQQASGAKVVRILLRYDQIARCNPGAAATNPTNACYDFTIPDAFIRGADERGMRVLLSVYGVPAWVFDGPENYLGDTDAQYNGFVAQYANFVQAAATRYDGRNGLPRVEQWTIWNEPNGSFFQPRWINGTLVGPQRYARMYDVAARRIKAVDASLKVGVGPTAPIASSLPPIEFASVALPELQRLGSPIDAWAHNAYLGKQSPFNTTIDAPYVGLGNVDDLTALMDRYAVTRGRDLWITEFGYQTAVEDKRLMTDSEQALLLTDAMRYAHWHPRISTFIWYSLFDDEASSGPYGFQSGIYKASSIRCDGKLCEKEAAAHFRHTVWVSPVSDGKVTLWGQARLQPAQTRLFVRLPNQQWRAYVNATTATTGTAQVRIRLVAGTEVTVCDTTCGPIRTLTAPVSGGGGGNIQRQQLELVRLSRSTSLARGISYAVPCEGCTVTATITARGRASNIRAAASRTVVVARGTVRRTSTRANVVLRFTAGARRELSRVRTSRLTIRTTIKYADGRTLIADRPLLLR